MRGFRLILVLLAVTGTTIAGCEGERQALRDMGGFVNEFETAAEFLNRRLNIEKWEYYTTGKSDSLEYYYRTNSEFLGNHDLLKQVENLRTFNNDENARRKLDIIYRICLRRALEAEPAVASLVDSIKTVYQYYEPSVGGKNISYAELYDMMAVDKNRQRRQEAYDGLSRAGGQLSEMIMRLFRMRNKSAENEGYNSYYDLMLIADNLGRDELDRLTSRVDDLTAEPYRKKLDSIKTALDLQNVQYYDLIFAGAKDNRRIDQYLGADLQIGIVKESFAGMGFNIDNNAIYYNGCAAGTALPRGEVLDVQVPHDIRVPYRVANGYESLQNLFNQFGTAIYLTNIEQEDYLLKLPPAPCFRLAMAEFPEAMTRYDNWLRRYGAIPEPVVMVHAAERDFMTLLELRRLLLFIEFEKTMYSEPYTDAAAVFRGLVEKYLFIPAPQDAGFWASNLFLAEQPVWQHNELLARCIVAHIMHYIRDKYGPAVDNDRCREILVQNFYRFGAFDDWRKLISRGTNEELNPAYLLEFNVD